MKGKLLIEQFDPNEFKQEFKSIVTEASEGKEKSFRVIGPMIVCETKNKNNRSYKKDSMSKEVEKFNKLCEQNHLSTRIGMDHPPTAELPLKDTCGRILGLFESKTNSNVYLGEVEIFPNSPYGGTIIDMINRNMFPGFSTRALGNVVEGIVEEVNLISVDFVADPSASVYVEQKFFENKTFENKGGLLVECVEEPKIEPVVAPVVESKPAIDKSKIVLEMFNDMMNAMDFYKAEDIEPSTELRKFYSNLVEINGKESADRMVQNIVEQKITVFNESLEKIGYKIADRRSKISLMKLVTESDFVYKFTETDSMDIKNGVKNAFKSYPSFEKNIKIPKSISSDKEIEVHVNASNGKEANLIAKRFEKESELKLVTEGTHRWEVEMKMKTFKEFSQINETKMEEAKLIDFINSDFRTYAVNPKTDMFNVDINNQGTIKKEGEYIVLLSGKDRTEFQERNVSKIEYSESDKYLNIWLKSGSVISIFIK